MMSMLLSLLVYGHDVTDNQISDAEYDTRAINMSNFRNT